MALELPSSEPEILSAADHASSRRPSTRPARETNSAFTATARAGASAQGSARTAKLPEVLELSDGSADEGPGRRVQAEDSDEDVVVVVGPSKLSKRARLGAGVNPSSAASDDLPAPQHAFASRYSSHTMGRSASMTVGTSASAGLTARLAFLFLFSPLSSAHTILLPQSAPFARAKTLSALREIDDLPVSAFSLPSGFSSSPALPQPAPPAANPKGKGKRRAIFNADNFDLPPELREDEEDMAETQLADDPWADILDEPTPAKGKEKKSKGKKKDDDEGGAGKKKGKKRLFNNESGSEGEGGTVSKAAGKAKAPRLSNPDKPAKRPSPLSSTSAASTSTAGLSKTALRKQETAERMRLREANTLRAGDKKVSTAELTVHISGKAFAGSDEEDSDDSDGMYAVPSAAKKKGKGKKKKPSAWLEISEGLKERLKLYTCDVELPEVPRRDVACEGALRWTRLCDRKWDEGRKMFLPLADGEKIVVEEDSRLIFLTAHDLSHHVASGTLSTHIASIQSHLPPHVNLFILLYGLNTLFRDLERVRRENYRAQVRAANGEDEPAGGGGGGKKGKPAGIGENQPSVAELELELMRVQIKSRCKIVSVDKVAEAVDWLEQITFDVGQKPYQRLKHSHVALLGSSEDKIPSGKDLQDTYIKMLASLPRVTEAVAKGIVAEYPTMRELYESWEKCRSEKERREMLVGIGKGRNVNGTATHRAIGTTLSTSIYKIMTSRDPSMYL
ncbi:hypothetical protein JCM8547_007321 [Rhodosporidiobolus lusitaniae]